MDQDGRNYSFSSHFKRTSAAERRARTAKHAQKLVRKGQILHPLTIKGRTIARTFLSTKHGVIIWQHIEIYGDRLPFGLTYARNGSIFDLEIVRGQIVATLGLIFSNVCIQYFG